MLRSVQLSGSLGEYAGHRYPFTTMWVNGRNVSIERIVSGREAGHSAAEESAFAFIRAWSSGDETFELRTSGSTGTPKTISISRNQMMASSLSTSEKINLQEKSVALICIDPKYIGGKMMLARCLTLGLPMVVVDPMANPLIKIPIDKCVQFTAFVPYQVSAILESKHPHLLNNLKTVLIGGAPLHEHIARQLDHFQCACYETYGMTETISHIALRLVNTEMKQPYFETLSGIDITKDQRGCLVIRADYLSEPVFTNDLVDIIGPGKFLWQGRFDSVINTGGVKVMPEKVEKELRRIFHRHHFSHRFLIAALPDEKLGNKVVLVLEGVQFSSETLDRSLAELRTAVSSFEFPKEVYTVAEFVMTGTKKINRLQTLAAVTRHASAI